MSGFVRPVRRALGASLLAFLFATGAPASLLAQSAAPAAPVSPPAAAHPSPAAAQGAPAAAATPSVRPNPHAAGVPGPATPSLLEDGAQISPGLPPGSIEAVVQDASGAPLAAQPVQLEVSYHNIAEGDETKLIPAITDALGVARFDGNSLNSDFSYRVIVAKPPANFYSEELRLSPSAGTRAVLHLHDVSRDMREAQIGTRTIIFVQPQDALFRFDVSYRVYNVGTLAWVPEGVNVALPAGAQALTMQEMSTDQRVTQVGDNVVLQGTFPPRGQVDLRFNFVLDRTGRDKQLLTVGLPPRMADLQIIVEAAPGMGMKVLGFSDTRERIHTTGQRLLEVVENYLQTQRQSPPDAKILLSGLPTPSQARWVAVLLAAAFVLGGIGVLLARREHVHLLATEDVQQARSLLLQELVTLELAHRQGQVGPKTYDQARSTLLTALTRLEARLAVSKAPASPA